MGVGPSTGSWLNFQRPHPQRKGALPPLKAIVGWRAAPQLWEAFPSPCCNVDWIIFCRQARLEWVHEFNSLIMTRRHCFSAVLLTSVFFTVLLISFLWRFLSLEGRQCDMDVPFVAEHSTDTYSLHFDQLRVSALTSVHRTKKLPWWGLSAVPIYR